MKIIAENWSVKELNQKRAEIDPRPQYQRAPVWDKARKQFLIDSILKGYDIPKIYLKGSRLGDQYTYEVTDGQQRLSAILDFYDGAITVPKNCNVDGHNLSGLTYAELPKAIQRQFDNFDIHVSFISECQAWELNDLFTRLQKGVSLIPVELRHAMMGEIRDAVQVLLRHPFFEKSKIEDRRFKRQDYLDHAIAECYYKVKTDLKAPTLYTLYSDLSDNKEEVKKLVTNSEKVLDTMNQINLKHPGLFKNKWGFADVFVVLYRNLKKVKASTVETLADTIYEFEVERKQYVSKYEDLLHSPTKSKFKRDMYDYIQAFTREGAFKYSVDKRYRIMEKVILQALN